MNEMYTKDETNQFYLEFETVLGEIYQSPVTTYTHQYAIELMHSIEEHPTMPMFDKGKRAALKSVRVRKSFPGKSIHTVRKAYSDGYGNYYVETTKPNGGCVVAGWAVVKNGTDILDVFGAKSAATMQATDYERKLKVEVVAKATIDQPIQTIENRAIDTLKALVDQVGIRDRNMGYNDFDQVYLEATNILEELENRLYNPKTYGENIDEKVNIMISDFHALGRSTIIDDPAETVIHQLKMKQFILEQALDKFNSWLDAEAE